MVRRAMKESDDGPPLRQRGKGRQRETQRSDTEAAQALAGSVPSYANQLVEEASTVGGESIRKKQAAEQVQRGGKGFALNRTWAKKPNSKRQQSAFGGGQIHGGKKGEVSRPRRLTPPELAASEA